jgi:hypothetical protein
MGADSRLVFPSILYSSGLWLLSLSNLGIECEVVLDYGTDKLDLRLLYA